MGRARDQLNKRRKKVEARHYEEEDPIEVCHALILATGLSVNFRVIVGTESSQCGE